MLRMKVGATLSSTGTLTHLGIKNTFTTEQLAALKCSASVSSNSSNTTGNSNVSAITSPPPSTVKSSAVVESLATATVLTGAVIGALL
ncbi:hypothetical protein THRCLA_21116 [Thraustotheca clavata]|uniref:Secreted protein n=1 Tax=Thraustotheca clavata TaxID=74557 RepID=A0A1W0A0A0_9STRA|nr:hypothetical protein THRCLA_21116 [Thraustotheca clavata]